MFKLSDKKRFSLVPLVISSIILSMYIVIPLLLRLDDIVEFYEPVLNETTPTIVVDTGRLEFDGSLPHRITLANGVDVFFDTTINDSLFQHSPPKSIFLAEKEIWLKRNNDIKKFLANDIRMDRPLVLNPLEVKEKLLRFRNMAFIIIGVLSVFCLLMGLLLLNFIAAGLGIMIDGFANGPSSFGELLNWASLFLFFFMLVWIIFGVRSVHSSKILVFLYFAIFIIFVYLNVLVSNRKKSS